jgi:amino acid transporter
VDKGLKKGVRAKGQRRSGEARDKGLKKDAIGFTDGLAIGLASTAPAYSLAAVIGSIVVAAGLQEPAVLLLSFVPMFLIATAFYYLNKADQDCGTNFSWVTRALGPTPGWLAGWAVFSTGVLVVGSLADVAAFYLFDILGLDGLRDNRVAVVILSLAIIAAMTTVCVIGTDISARMQRILVFAQVGALVIFAVVALVRVWLGDAPHGIDPNLDWVSPFAISDYSAMLSGLLLGVFIYWGWESCVNLNEETRDSARTPGLAAIASTLILLATYLGVGIAVLSFAGPDQLDNFAGDEGVLGKVADQALGPLSFIVILAIITSGLSSAQTTILPSSRTSLSMADHGALPAILGRVHPKFKTPDVSTVLIGVLAAVWYVGASAISSNFLLDSLSALSLLIAFYYALTGVSCAIYYRHELLGSARNFVFMGVAPVAGAAMLVYLLVESGRQLANPADSASHTSIYGVGIPLVVAVVFILLGVVFMTLWRRSGRREFFARPAFEAVPPSGRAAPATTEAS